MDGEYGMLNDMQHTFICLYKMTSTIDSHHWRPRNTSIPSFDFTELTDGKDDVKRFGPYGLGLTLDNGYLSAAYMADHSTPTSDQKTCIRLEVHPDTRSGSLCLSMDPPQAKQNPYLLSSLLNWLIKLTCLITTFQRMCALIKFCTLLDIAAPYLWINAHMHFLSGKIGPCIYLSNAERCEMITIYGDQVIKALKNACMEFLLGFQNKKGSWGTWHTLEPAAKEQFLIPVEKITVSKLIEIAFPDRTSILYPLMMEMMHYGALQSAGWCIVQVFTIHLYFCYVTLMHQHVEPKTEIKSAVKGNKGKIVEDVNEELSVEAEELTIADVHATTPVNLPAASLALFIPSQTITDGFVEWMGPTEEDIDKVDCDGAFTQPKMNKNETKVVKEGHGGYGCVVLRLKNRVPEVIIALSGASKPLSPFYHEVEGLLCGPCHALKSKCRRVEMSTDCKQAILEVERGFGNNKASRQGPDKIEENL
ncbi:hypothetical protein MKW98_010659 [Papaver atlanticum]|uniref:Uncharacterized protein n=1 Tax=Papaver atlanticum TaxID=357466 RepID=A0AAD4SJH7_9MAGN|nr:hypothetical protein MKW98_010659 [Papaver atlanticum]